MALPKINWRLMNRVLKHVKAKPKRIFMGNWARSSTEVSCGTQACIAGWTVILAKGNTQSARKMVINKEDELDTPTTQSWVLRRAKRLLGLTQMEAEVMFLRDTHLSGRQAVKLAEAKVALLKKDRAAFVEKYKY